MVVGGGAAAVAARRCLIDASTHGRSAELVLIVPRDDGAQPLIQMIRVRPGQPVEVISGSSAVGLPRLWELQRCAAVGGEGPDLRLTLSECGDLLPLGATPSPPPT